MLTLQTIKLKINIQEAHCYNFNDNRADKNV